MYLRTVDYPDEFHNGFHIMLDSEEPVTSGLPLPRRIQISVRGAKA